MNMQTTSRLTAAETALIEAFNQQIGELPGNGAVTALRDRLLDDLKKAGLPTRRIEAWHYTDLKNLLRTVPPQAGDAGSEALEPLVADATVLAVIQGHSNQKATADGLGVSAYSERLLDGSAAGGLDALGSDDAVGRINGSFVRDGYVIDVPADADLENPLEIQFIHAGGQIHTRLPVSFGAGVKATVIERHLTVTGDAALVSHVSDITVGEGTELTWIILQQQGPTIRISGRSASISALTPSFGFFVINAGGRLVRQELNIKVTGEGADLTLRGINLLGGDSHTDVTMVLGHDVPNTGSTEVIPQRRLRPRQGCVPGHDPGRARCAEDRCQDGLQHAADVRRCRILGQARA
ncbi:SufD family Fe-S cluster assembly protein [Rhizobium beringeri]